VVQFDGIVGIRSSIFSISSSGSSRRCVVPSARGWASSNSSGPCALSVNRSRASGGARDSGTELALRYKGRRRRALENRRRASLAAAVPDVPLHQPVTIAMEANYPLTVSYH
jgi:hypothetical protein